MLAQPKLWSIVWPGLANAHPSIIGASKLAWAFVKELWICQKKNEQPGWAGTLWALLNIIIYMRLAYTFLPQFSVWSLDKKWKTRVSFGVWRGLIRTKLTRWANRGNTCYFGMIALRLSRDTRLRLFRCHNLGRYRPEREKQRTWINLDWRVHQSDYGDTHSLALGIQIIELQ
jgi:hypothetical protein